MIDQTVAEALVALRAELAANTKETKRLADYQAQMNGRVGRLEDKEIAAEAIRKDREGWAQERDAKWSRRETEFVMVICALFGVLATLLFVFH